MERLRATAWVDPASLTAEVVAHDPPGVALLIPAANDVGGSGVFAHGAVIEGLTQFETDAYRQRV
ncbi:MAG: hypothetical protein ACRD0F_06815 [Acidimicrobiales bacterium]